MKFFKQIINEVTSFENSSLWVLSDRGFEWKNSRGNPTLNHPEAFPRVYFPDRTKSDLMTIDDSMPIARAWGRIDHRNKDFHIMTDHGMEPYGVGIGENHKKTKEDDAFTRLKALKTLTTNFPGYRMHWGHEGDPGNLTPVMLSTKEAEKRLMSHLGELSEDIQIFDGTSPNSSAMGKDWSQLLDAHRRFNTRTMRHEHNDMGSFGDGYRLHRVDVTNPTNVRDDHIRNYYIVHEPHEKVVGHLSAYIPSTKNPIGENETLSISTMDIHPRHRQKFTGGRSLAIDLYKYLSNAGHRLVSGSSQSHGGAYLWQRLMRDPEIGPRVKLFINYGKQSVPASPMRSKDIWAADEDDYDGPPRVIPDRKIIPETDPVKASDVASRWLEIEPRKVKK